MKRHESSITTGDGLTLYCQGWFPQETPRALVVLVHGLGEHSGRYDHLGAHLIEAGYALLSFDLRGHGRSEGKRGHIPSMEAFIEDLDLVIDAGKSLFPNIPKYIYGHSLGSNIVLYFVLKRKPELGGCIVTGVGLHTSLREQRAKVAIAQIAGGLVPGISLPSGLDPHTLSRDPEVIKAYIEDPLVHDQATFGFAKHNLDAIDWILDHAQEFTIPLLIMHGTADKLNYISGGQELESKVSVECTLKVWEGLYHEIHNEPEKDQIFAYLIEWLERKNKEN